MSTRASLPHLASAAAAPASLAQSSFAWKEELNARLREHRQRRAGQEVQEEAPAPASRPRSGIADRVARRYDGAPSYSELLAASAAAADAAGSAAEAALQAHAAARAVLSEWDAQAERRQVAAPADGELEPEFGKDTFNDPFFTEPAQPRWEETAAPAPQQTGVMHHAPLPERSALPERPTVTTRARALVDAFAEAVVPAAVQLPAKLIEFPHELIAGYRNRPRLAEGPLAEPHSDSTLRIFEVSAPLAADDSMLAVSPSAAAGGTLDFDGPMSSRDQNDEFEPMPRRRSGFDLGAGEQESAHVARDQEPAAASSPAHRAASRARTPMTRAARNEDVAPPWKGSRAEPQTGWSSIRLGEQPQTETDVPAASEPQAAAHAARAAGFASLASLADRCLAALMDFSMVLACFLFALLVFASCTTHMPTGKGAVALGVMTLGVMSAFYGWLFMTYGGGNTPGMRYARIALCTFDDANPTRKELQNRVPATALALLPLGLGLIWALMDDDRLGWHDRMTRTYQRSYR